MEDIEGTSIHGFVGLGNMGGPMAANLAASCFRVLVYDLEVDRTRLAVERGAQATTTLSDLAAACDVIHIIVVNAAQVREVVLGPHGGQGLVHSVAPDTLAIVHSTIGHPEFLDLAAEAGSQGLTLIDAPVSGGDRASRAGTLTFFVGGPTSAFVRCRPALEVMGDHIFHLGGPGAGLLGKLTNNLAAILNQVTAREALDFARQVGLDTGTMLAALEASTADSWSLRHSWAARTWRGEVDPDRYTTGASGLAEVLRKDLHAAIEAAREHSVDLPMARTGLDGIDTLLTGLAPPDLDGRTVK